MEKQCIKTLLELLIWSMLLSPIMINQKWEKSSWTQLLVMLHLDLEKSVMLLLQPNLHKFMPKNSTLMYQKWWNVCGEITISTQKLKNGKKVQMMMRENQLKEHLFHSLWNQLLD